MWPYCSEVGFKAWTRYRNHFPHAEGKWRRMGMEVFLRLACVYVCVQSLSCVWLLATPSTVARQAPLYVGFSRQEYWSGLPFLTPRYLANPGIKSKSCIGRQILHHCTTWDEAGLSCLECLLVPAFAGIPQRYCSWILDHHNKASHTFSVSQHI